RGYADTVERLGRQGELERVLSELTQAHPQEAALWGRLAEARLGLGDHEQAATALAAWTDLEPDNLDAWRKLASCRGRLGGAGELEAQQAITRIEPTDAAAQAFLGRHF